MPPRAVTIEIRDTAQAKIKASAAVLAARFGIPLPAPVGFDGRDPDFLRARELESIAGFMDALAGNPGSDEAKALTVKLAKAEKQVGILTEEDVLLRAEIAALTAAWQEAEAKLALAGIPTSADAVPGLPPPDAGDVTDIGFGGIGAVEDGSITIDMNPVTIDAIDGELSLTEQVDLSRMNRTSLNEYAASRGIADVESFATKAELIAAIEALPK